jgi:hypothetical protein
MLSEYVYNIGNENCIKSNRYINTVRSFYSILEKDSRQTFIIRDIWNDNESAIRFSPVIHIMGLILNYFPVVYPIIEVSSVYIPLFP